MADYIVNRTDSTAPSIDVQEKRIETSLDVTLFGKIRLEYGERLNEDLLNVLENFACPELADSEVITPDVYQTTQNQLANPTAGQFWFNSTRELIFFWTGEEWTQTQVREDVAANWGQIMDGQQVPRPVSAVTGYTFPYDECIWSVAPSVLVGKIGYMACTTDANATLTMRYRLSGTSNIVSGQANYLIIGMRNGGTNTGPFITPPAISPTPSVTPSITMTASITPTPVVSPTPTPAVTTTPTPTITNTPNPTVSATVTPTRAPSSTPGASATPTPTSAPSPTPTPTTSPPVTKLGFDGYQYEAVRYLSNGEHLVQRLNIEFTNTGTWTISAVYGGSTNLITSGPTTGTWLPSGGSASDYSIQIINTSFYNNSVGQPSASEQPTATKDANINWTVLSANVSWNAQATSGYQDGVNNSGEGRGDGTTVIYIRHTASNTIVSTTTLNFSVICSN